MFLVWGRADYDIDRRCMTIVNVVYIVVDIIRLAVSPKYSMKHFLFKEAVYID